MRTIFLIAGVFAVAATLSFPRQGSAAPNATTLSFAVTRDGEPIGTSTVHLLQEGDRTLARAVTRIAVKIAYWTVYRFEQTDNEEFADGRLQALTSVTDDNGTVHRVDARNRGNLIAVDADGKRSQVDPTLIPASPWNPSIVHKSVALNPQNGTVTPVSVVDHGEEQLMVGGRPTTAHHYSITTSFRQDVWYDRDRQLVRIELRASDGSQIRYQPG